MKERGKERVRKKERARERGTEQIALKLPATGKLEMVERHQPAYCTLLYRTSIAQKLLALLLHVVGTPRLPLRLGLGSE